MLTPIDRTCTTLQSILVHINNFKKILCNGNVSKKNEGIIVNNVIRIVTGSH